MCLDTRLLHEKSTSIKEKPAFRVETHQRRTQSKKKGTSLRNSSIKWPFVMFVCLKTSLTNCLMDVQLIYKRQEFQITWFCVAKVSKIAMFLLKRLFFCCCCERQTKVGTSRLSTKSKLIRREITWANVCAAKLIIINASNSKPHIRNLCKLWLISFCFFFCLRLHIAGALSLFKFN